LSGDEEEDFMPHLRLTIAAGCAAAMLAACQQREAAPPADNGVAANGLAGNDMDNGTAAAGVPASFNFAGADGQPLGSVTLSEDPAGLMINIAATGMPQGVHGLHLHEKGLCEGPTFESAGAHWNPQSKQHGKDNPMGAHMGDLPNLTIAADGTATTSIPATGTTMAALADADGTSIVVHAKADDYKTDPSGDSGDRIACAVLAAPTGN
jgi:Cu-Zn family superoxide dismutase